METNILYFYQTTFFSLGTRTLYIYFAAEDHNQGAERLFSDVTVSRDKQTTTRICPYHKVYI